MRRMSWLLIIALLAATFTGVCAGEGWLPEEIVSAPVEEAIGDVEADLGVREDGAAARERAVLPNAVYTSGNLAHFSRLKDGDTVPTGRLDIYLTFDDDGVWDESGRLKDESAIVAAYMPALLSVTRVGSGQVDVTNITNNHIAFNGTDECYATVTLDEPGMYRLSVASAHGSDDPETIGITVDGSAPAPSDPDDPGSEDPDNPGYYIYPESTEYTINLAQSRTQRVRFTLSCYRYEATAGFIGGDGEDASGETVVRCADWPRREDLVWSEKDGKYVADAWFDYEGVKVGTVTIKIGILVVIDGKPYGQDREITIHVIDDPVPTPTEAPAKKSLKNAKVAVGDVTYSGKAQKPAVTVKLDGVKLTEGKHFKVSYTDNRAVGTATVKVTGIAKGGYTGSKAATFKVRPRKVAGLSVRAGKGALTVTWKKAAGVSGYQIQYGLKTSFKGAKTRSVKKTATKAVINKLKQEKTYHVRIRAYKTVKGKKYWSAWASAKKKTK